ncbi:hypothetical protein OF83DRAFT_1087015 [Amylostereum chailletii]|nr:hypothetical protein OF83DRAFT_1087015 [Amylostereum chailletii]
MAQKDQNNIRPRTRNMAAMEFQYNLFLPVTPTGPFPDLGIVVAELVHGANQGIQSGMLATPHWSFRRLGWALQTLEIVSEFNLRAEDITPSVPLAANLILVCLVKFCNVFYSNITVNLASLAYLVVRGVDSPELMGLANHCINRTPEYLTLGPQESSMIHNKLIIYEAGHIDLATRGTILCLHID